MRKYGSNVTIYLPEDLALWSKDAKVNVSRITRNALEAERARLDEVAEQVAEAAAIFTAVRTGHLT
jgi:post-segregation antitoxin (ccd killing protein)